MKISYLFLLLALAVSSRSCLAAPGKIPERGFFFVQMADPQFGMWSGNKDTSREEETFRKAVEHVNRLRPAFVLISGDIVNVAHDPEQTRAFWSIARTIRRDIPLYLVPGNHDVGTGHLDDSIRAYEKDFGRDHYAFTRDGTRFIVLDSNIVANAKDNPRLEQAQRWWFEAQLSAAKSAHARHIVVCTHHPWFLKAPDEKDEYFNIPLAQRAWYLERMRTAGVEMALAGHLHQESFGTAGRLQMITTGPIGKPLGKDPSGFRIVCVYPDRIISQYFGLDVVPDHVTM